MLSPWLHMSKPRHSLAPEGSSLKCLVEGRAPRRIAYYDGSGRTRRMGLEGSLAVTTNEDSVRFVFTVINSDVQPRELRYRDGQAAEFVVLEGDREVWRWSEGRMFTQALWEESLAPGETAEYEATWNAPYPGSYTAKAALNAQNATLMAESPFEIEVN